MKHEIDLEQILISNGLGLHPKTVIALKKSMTDGIRQALEIAAEKDTMCMVTVAGCYGKNKAEFIATEYRKDGSEYYFRYCSGCLNNRLEMLNGRVISIKKFVADKQSITDVINLIK